MSDRQLILAAVQEMPETASFHEIVEELVVMAEMKHRLKKNPQGQGVSAEELLAKVSTWAAR